MSISFSGSTLTFSDSTTMTTAAVAGPPGPTGPAGSPSSVAGPPGPTGPAGSPGPSGSTLVSSVNLAGASTVCFTGLSYSYKYYYLSWRGVRGPGGAIMMRVSTDNGSSYYSTNIYGYSCNNNPTSFNNCRIIIGYSQYTNGGLLPSGTGPVATGYSVIHNGGAASGAGAFTTSSHYLHMSSACVGCRHMYGYWKYGVVNVPAVNAIRIYCDSGNFVVGTMDLFGVS